MFDILLMVGFLVAVLLFAIWKSKRDYKKSLKDHL